MAPRIGCNTPGQRALPQVGVQGHRIEFMALGESTLPKNEMQG